MRIEDEIKLDFKDVLIRPKRSTLSSRKEVNLLRSYTFKHSKHEWTGVPIMAANMDGVGTLKMAEALHPHKKFTCLVKSLKPDDLKSTFENISGEYLAASTGTSDSDFDNLVKL